MFKLLLVLFVGAFALYGFHVGRVARSMSSGPRQGVWNSSLIVAVFFGAAVGALLSTLAPAGGLLGWTFIGLAIGSTTYIVSSLVALKR
ncbi:MAG: hypothetical protein K2W82_17250 [Candidatus Obscuribacterales bacterium]|jgi:hypothetical protein|nr:hypothetical protein [Candidatus Obscuribacterales bacterium]